MNYKKEKNKALFFIIPKNYIHKEDLRKRVKQNDKYKQVSIKYWDDFVKKYKKDKDVKKMLKRCLYLKNSIN